MVHPDTKGAQKIPDSEDLIKAQEARGWKLDQLPEELDEDAINRGLAPGGQGVILGRPEDDLPDRPAQVEDKQDQDHEKQDRSPSSAKKSAVAKKAAAKNDQPKDGE